MLARRTALALAAAAAVTPSLARAQAAPATVRVGQVPADTYAEAFFAQELGAFTRAGLTVELTSFNNGAAMAAACAGGSIDVGVGDATEIANGVLRGLPFTLIAGGGLYTSSAPTTLLCVAKSSPLQRAAELEGQSVAVISLVSLMSSAVKAWLTQNGADIAKIKFIELPFPQMGGALARGAIAAASISEPAFTAASADVRVFGKPYDAIAPEFLISDWFTTRDWVTKNPDVARRFVGAIYETARWANTHQDLSAVMLAKMTKIDVERIRVMKRALFATALDPNRVQPVLDTALKFKSLEAPVRATALIARI